MNCLVVVKLLFEAASVFINTLSTGWSDGLLSDLKITIILLLCWYYKTMFMLKRWRTVLSILFHCKIILPCCRILASYFIYYFSDNNKQLVFNAFLKDKESITGHLTYGIIYLNIFKSSQWVWFSVIIDISIT